MNDHLRANQRKSAFPGQGLVLGFEERARHHQGEMLSCWARQTIVVSRPSICLFGEENRPVVLVPHDVRRCTTGL